MGQYQNLLMNHLREHRPTEYAGLQAAGDLESHVQEVGDEISEAVEAYRQQLLQAKPAPRSTWRRCNTSSGRRGPRRR